MENEPNHNEGEQEQSPAEILRIINEALESGSNLMIIQYLSKGEKETIEGVGTPVSLEGDILEVDAAGYQVPIDINLIKYVEISWESEE